MADIEKYLRKSALPHIWCPGCGNGTLLAAILRAIDKLQLNQQKTVIVSGIGCSSRASGYMNFNTVHTAHGRALTFATGIKLADPELNVILITGDGDCTAIGGNHFIHAARRNIDITTIVFNNSIYGMTGGQFSPLTPKNSKATTAPFGHIERSFDIAQLAIGAGATYVARGTAYHAAMLTDLIVKGIENKGFSVIDGITQCPIGFGRKNKMGTAAAMLAWQRDHAVMAKAAARMSPEELEGKFLIGELHHVTAPEYTAEYTKLVARLQKGGKV
ncbi:2-oxoglutarate synthase subunit KorB [Propionispora sp. 2/2-37]|uniref:2-oxoacid:ferredoxin oxidoreductase subunit beta n=1 Tax=Propionispora sp. 2/2-37 TaxID=1677858 RepID=UPI0006BB68BB|nr:2-oxoacid:ferredoxin oxidoreductase subunit beta [Propionispora sp. 2/2-37]CUH94003.1 2-oxoglutarate synthase subunit KorB [Propionispora sp. 2/2-37]